MVPDGSMVSTERRKSDVLAVIVIFNSGFRVTFFPLVSLLFDLHV